MNQEEENIIRQEMEEIKLKLKDIDVLLVEDKTDLFDEQNRIRSKHLHPEESKHLWFKKKREIEERRIGHLTIKKDLERKMIELRNRLPPQKERNTDIILEEILIELKEINKNFISEAKQ